MKHLKIHKFPFKNVIVLAIECKMYLKIQQKKTKKKITEVPSTTLFTWSWSKEFEQTFSNWMLDFSFQAPFIWKKIVPPRRVSRLNELSWVSPLSLHFSHQTQSANLWHGKLLGLKGDPLSRKRCKKAIIKLKIYTCYILLVPDISETLVCLRLCCLIPAESPRYLTR